METVQNKITLAAIAAQIGLEETDNTLPNGKVIRQHVFESVRDSERIFKAVEKMAEKCEGRFVLLDGPFPMWLLATVTHALHPRFVSVWNPMLQGSLICSPCRIGEHSEVSYEDGNVNIAGSVEGSFYVVDVKMSANVTDPAKVCLDMEAPTLPVGVTQVLIRGRSIGAIIAQLCDAYAHRVADVSVQGVDGNNIVVISHGGRPYGTVWRDS